jgi:hypothetical protein
MTRIKQVHPLAAIAQSRGAALLSRSRTTRAQPHYSRAAVLLVRAQP